MALFSLYDTDQSGVISYREFASDIFGFDCGSAAGQNDGDALVEKLRAKLATRGARGIIGLGRNFRIMDDNHSMSLDKYEFAKAMGDFAIGLNEGEIGTLFGIFDGNHNGLVEYDEFLRIIRGPMNQTRLALVKQAFGIMDKDGSGSLDYNDLKGVYSGAKHPDVLSGRRSEQQVLQEWLETFETAHSMRVGGTNDSVITLDEWTEYYCNVSASIDRDDYFALMMNNAWNLDGKRVTKKGSLVNEKSAAGGFSAKKGLDGGMLGAISSSHNKPKEQHAEEGKEMNYSEK